MPPRTTFRFRFLKFIGDRIGPGCLLCHARHAHQVILSAEIDLIHLFINEFHFMFIGRQSRDHKQPRAESAPLMVIAGGDRIIMPVFTKISIGAPELAFRGNQTDFHCHMTFCSLPAYSFVHVGDYVRRWWRWVVIRFGPEVCYECP